MQDCYANENIEVSTEAKRLFKKEKKTFMP